MRLNKITDLKNFKTGQPTDRYSRFPYRMKLIELNENMNSGNITKLKCWKYFPHLFKNK